MHERSSATAASFSLPACGADVEAGARLRQGIRLCMLASVLPLTHKHRIKLGCWLKVRQLKAASGQACGYAAHTTSSPPTSPTPASLQPPCPPHVMSPTSPPDLISRHSPTQPPLTSAATLSTCSCRLASSPSTTPPACMFITTRRGGPAQLACTQDTKPK